MGINVLIIKLYLLKMKGDDEHNYTKKRRLTPTKEEIFCVIKLQLDYNTKLKIKQIGGSSE